MILVYLIGELHKKDKKIYIDLLKGMLIREGDERKVCRILKSLYNLKQSARLWNKKIITYLQNQKLKPFSSDASILIDYSRGLLITLYIDDLLITAVTITTVKELKKTLYREFKIKDLEEVEIIINIYIRRNREARTLLINQSAYINKLLEKEGILKYHSTLTPIKISGYGFLFHENQKKRIDVNKY